MPGEDSQRWDERYLKDARESFLRPRPFLVENAHLLPTYGVALDVAMGLGGNAGFLLSRGLRVLGVDISGVAVKRAKVSYPALDAIVTDLYNFHLLPATFDVILNFFFLQRDLWHEYERGLKPGGVLFFETLVLDAHAQERDADLRFYLSPGELEAAFPSLETLVYREGISASSHGSDRRTAALIARRPPEN